MPAPKQGKTPFISPASPDGMKLEAKGLVKRQRAEDDERKMTISVTDTGMALRARAACIPAWITDGVALSREDRAQLHRLLFRFLGREIPL